MRLRILLAVATLLVYGGGLLVAAQPRWGGALWGLHAWTYLDPAMLAGVLVLSVGAGALLLAAPPFPVRGRSRVGLTLLVLGLLALARDTTHLLGDGRLWISVLSGSRAHHPHEPFAFALAWLATVGAKGTGVVTLRAELLSLGLGAVAFALMVSLAHRFGATARERWSILGLLTATGLLQFGAGYIEAYPLLWVGLLAYLRVAVSAIDRPDRLPWTALVAGGVAGIHGTGFLLLPSLGWLGARLRPSRILWLVSGSAFLVPIVLAYLVLPRALPAPPGTAPDGQSALAGVAQLLGGISLHSHGVGSWLLDQVNRWALVAPLSLGFVVAFGSFRNRATTLFAVSGAGLLLPACLLDPGGSRGASLDWDVFSVGVVPITLWAAVSLAGRVEARRDVRLIAAVGTALAVLGTASFLIVNAHPPAAFARYVDLLESPRWSPRTRAMAAETLAAAYRDAGDPDSSRVWYLRAADLDPGNPRMARNAAILLSREGRHEEAADRYRELVARGHQDAEVWFRIGRELEAGGNPSGAEAAYRASVGLEATPGALNGLARVLLSRVPVGPGPRQEAVAAIRRSLELDATQPEAARLRAILEDLAARP